jgi:TonB family protein
MRLAVVFGIFALHVAAVPAATTQKVYVFRGKIQSVDAAARTFTLHAEKKTYVFNVTDETKIAQNGAARKFTDLKRDKLAEVDMKIGPGGKAFALSVKLIPSSDIVGQSYLAATTPNGKILSAQEVKPLILAEPWPSSVAPSGPIVWEHKTGVFLLSVRSDGTVAKVEILQSIGQSSLDAEWVKAFMKWRFRPNSVKEVRVPGDYVRSY